MILTPQQIEELTSLIDRHILLFTAHRIGVDILTPTQIDTLVQSGIDVSNINTTSSIREAFMFGILSTMLSEGNLKNMTYEQLKTHIQSNTTSLNSLQLSSLQSLQLQTYNDVSRLGSKIKHDIIDSLVYADKTNHTVKHSRIVTDAVGSAIKQRKSVTEAVSIIGEKTEAWNRDLGRIADYVMHTAFDEGRASGYEKISGQDALVYKDVYPGACKHCMRILLTQPTVGSQPNVFKLSELRANGTNVGRKVDELLPVIGPIHPWCRCTLKNTPSGFTLQGLETREWIWNGYDFVRDTSQWQRQVQRRSRVNINFNGKQSQI